MPKVPSVNEADDGAPADVGADDVVLDTDGKLLMTATLDIFSPFLPCCTIDLCDCCVAVVSLFSLSCVLLLPLLLFFSSRFLVFSDATRLLLLLEWPASSILRRLVLLLVVPLWVTALVEVEECSPASRDLHRLINVW